MFSFIFPGDYIKYTSTIDYGLKAVGGFDFTPADITLVADITPDRLLLIKLIMH